MSTPKKLKIIFAIFDYLKTGPKTKGQIFDRIKFLANAHNDLDLELNERTFFRYKNAMLEYMGADMERDPSTKKYHLVTRPVDPESIQSYAKNFELAFMAGLNEEWKDYVFPEEFDHPGKEHFRAIMLAIRDRWVLNFGYTKFTQTNPTFRTVMPLALKEFRRRWYLLGMEYATKEFRVFGLDRISLLVQSTQKFEYPVDFTSVSKFKNVFGITHLPNAEVKEVVIETDVHTAQYLKSLPLHDSQQIVHEDDQKVRFSYALCITPDLIHEILSYGKQAKVLAPDELRVAVRDELKIALSYYD